MNTSGKAPALFEGQNLLFGCLAPSVSEVLSDGSYAVAFHSDAKDLVDPFDSGNTTQIFVRLPAINRTVLISKAATAQGGNIGANGSSEYATIAIVDATLGRYRICFASSATNLVIPNSSGNGVFCRDVRVVGNEITEESTAKITSVPSANSLTKPVLSADGSVLTFQSDGTIISSKQSNGFPQIYTYSFSSQSFRLITATAGGLPAKGISDMQSASRNGAAVVFRYSGFDLGGTADLKGFEATETTLLVHQTVATGINVQINTNAAGAPSNGGTVSGRLDSSGVYAVFSDSGTNIEASSNNKIQVYLKNISTGELARASVTTSGLAGDDDSGFETNASFAMPVAVGHRDSSANSPFVTFISFAPNLASIGSPSSTSPFVFRSVLVTPTPTPTPTPTATPTPRSISNNIKIIEPPDLEVLGKGSDGTYAISITCEKFTIGSSLFKSIPELVELLASGKARLTYAVDIRKAGSSKRITRVSSRNVVTVRKLSPGSYTVRYRVVATKGRQQIQSRLSPKVTIKLS